MKKSEGKIHYEKFYHDGYSTGRTECGRSILDVDLVSPSLMQEHRKKCGFCKRVRQQARKRAEGARKEARKDVRKERYKTA